MTLASGRGEHRALHKVALKLVDAILDGARDRGADKNLRPLLDQQQRTRPLTRARPRQNGQFAGKKAA
jgi:hypothetical protein